MSQVSENYTVCDQCGGAIPTGADRIGGLNATLYIGGQATAFANLDFCSTAHAAAFLGSHPVVPLPSPPYAPPPV